MSSGGGYLEVHAGRQLDPDRTVILKRLLVSPGSPERLAESLKAVRGPAIPPLVEVGTSPEGLWAVCEGVDGESMRWVMSTLARAAGFMAPHEGITVMARVALALEALHRQGLSHGDVCPTSVYVTAAGAVQLHCAGMAPHLGPHPEGGPWRSEPNFLAPEEVNGLPTSRSDVFRLGLMLYELAMGRPLWSGPGAAQAASAWEGLPREKVQQVPEPWQSLLVSMLALDPSARSTMHEVSVALENGIRQQGWSNHDDDVAKLFGRAAPGRTSPFAPEAAAPRLLMLAPLGGPSMTPPAPPTSPASVVARIATKKMTREMLAVQRPEVSTPTEPVAAVSAHLPLEVRVANLLIERGRIAKAQLTSAQETAETVGGSLSRALLTQLVVDEDALVGAAAELTKTPSITARKLAETVPAADALALVPRALARATQAVPLGLKGGSQLMVAMLDPLDAKATEQLKAAIGPRGLVAIRAGERSLQEALARLYPNTEATPSSDPLSLLGPAPQRPPLAPASELSTRLLDALLSSQGQRGVQAQQLVSLVLGLGKRLGLTPPELSEAGAAARTLVSAALVMGRLAHDVPTLAEVQDRLGCQTDADAYFEGLRAFPAKLPTQPPVRAVVLAFAFAAHAGEARPSSSRLGGALTSFKLKGPMPPALFEVLTAEVSRS